MSAKRPTSDSKARLVMIRNSGLSIDASIVPTLCRVIVKQDDVPIHDATSWLTPSEHGCATLEEAISQIKQEIRDDLMGIVDVEIRAM